MILDDGEVTIYRVASESTPGDMYSNKTKKLLIANYGYRTVGFSRYFAAHQVNAKVDTLIRILKPDIIKLKADDLCVLSDPAEDNAVFRILQAQYLRDEEAGEDVIDLSLERTGRKYEC